MSGIRDAQEQPGNGPGDGQSAAGAPPVGSQTSVRVYAREAGNPITSGAPSEGAYSTLAVDG